jgi:hypothetical protein
MGLVAFADARFDQADAPARADGEHGADDAGNGNDHRRQHEDRDQALQDRIPHSKAFFAQVYSHFPVIARLDRAIQ